MFQDRGELFTLDIKETYTCTICNKAPAKYQCDFPRRYLHIKTESKLLREVKQQTHLQTCDRYICENCAITMGDGIHICTECLQVAVGRWARK